MIAIPNIDKPKRCVDCVCNNDDYMCNVIHMGIDWQSQQANEDCPLIEIDEDSDIGIAINAYLILKKAREIIKGERRE